MYEAHQQRVRKLGRNGDLDEGQRKLLQAALMIKSVVRHHVHIVVSVMSQMASISISSLTNIMLVIYDSVRDRLS